MRIYLSGGMTGWEDNNQEEFDLAAEALTALGHDVVSPVELGRMDGEHLEGDGFNASDEEYEGFLERDLSLISKENLDAIAFVRGWKTSGGAGREGRRAIEAGLMLFVWNRRVPSILQVLTPEAFLHNTTTKRLERGEARVA